MIVHCENRQGLECLDGIAAVDGVDVVFVGPYDLSQSFGIPGQIYHPVMVDAVARALAAAKGRKAGGDLRGIGGGGKGTDRTGVLLHRLQHGQPCLCRSLQEHHRRHKGLTGKKESPVREFRTGLFFVTGSVREWPLPRRGLSPVRRIPREDLREPLPRGML